MTQYLNTLEYFRTLSKEDADNWKKALIENTNIKINLKERGSFDQHPLPFGSQDNVEN
jgi:hypothetical protein